jgi:hypothetical protein
MTPAASVSALEAYLGILAGRAEPDERLELRRRLPSGGMVPEFHPVRHPERLIRTVREHARRTDVYVGCALRVRASGTEDAIRRVRTLWAECDGQAAVDAVHRFAPRASVIIGSGSGSNCHAYRPLLDPLTAPAAEAANLRLGRRSCVLRRLADPATARHLEPQAPAADPSRRTTRGDGARVRGARGAP